jgi:TatD DNase family protein
MMDVHCHLDAYPDPYKVAVTADQARVLTIAVTNLPSKFELAYPHVRPLHSIRLAVGLHPLHAADHQAERQLFAACLRHTSYVGEVGLDFSATGLPTRQLQQESFHFVLQLLQQQPKFVSVHSRRAETAVLDALEGYRVGPVVFHWFTGSNGQLDRLVSGGHYCSVNPAMVRSARGRSIIERLPVERILTETDGPYVAIGSRPAVPTDVKLVEGFLTQVWQMEPIAVRKRLMKNLHSAIPYRSSSLTEKLQSSE